MTNNNSLITGELNSTTKKNVPEKVDQVLIDASKNKEKDSFRRALEAFSDCI
jgi:predicted O-methyltransferase YrrM